MESIIEKAERESNDLRVVERAKREFDLSSIKKMPRRKDFKLSQALIFGPDYPRQFGAFEQDSNKL